jgi:hypothetical protein
MWKSTLRTTAVLAAAAAWAAVSCEGPVDTEPAYKGPWEAYDVQGLPEGTRINDVYMFSPTDGWAVANGSHFLRFDGMEWKVHTDLSQESYCAYVVDLDFSSPNEGWAVGYWYHQVEGNTVKEGFVFRYDGSAWRNVTPVITWPISGIGPLHCVSVNAPDNVWIGGRYGIYRYDGDTWFKDASFRGCPEALYFASGDEGWALTPGGIHRWAGYAWTPYYTRDEYTRLDDFYFTTTSTAWVVGYGGPTASRTPPEPPIPRRPSHPIWFWDGTRNLWEPYKDFHGKDDSLTFNRVHFAAPDDGWAVGRSTLKYDGSGWKWVPKPPFEAKAVFTLGGDEVWLACGDGKMYKYNPGTPE